jgi:hypothetical protein
MKSYICLIFFLSACGQATPEATTSTKENFKPTETRTSTITNTATKNPTAQPTKPQPLLTYKLHIENPMNGFSEVEIIYDYPPKGILEMGLGERGFKIPIINNFAAFDNDGNPIEVTARGTGGRFASVYQIDISSQIKVSISYDIDLNSLQSCGNILKSTYGAIEPEYTFYRPFIYGGPIKLLLDIPVDWPVVSIYDEGSGFYNIPMMDDFIWTPISFGSFHTTIHEINNVKMTLAFQDEIPDSIETDIINASTKIFDYYSLKIGNLSQSKKIPRTKYLLIFLPQTTNKVSSHETAYGYIVFAAPLNRPYWGEIPGATYDSWQAHMIGHAWQPGAFQVPYWFSEGIDTFYQFRSIEQTNIISNGQYQKVMVSLYSWYTNNLLNTNKDLSLFAASQYSGQFDEKIYRINYWKAALVAHIINETLISITGEEVNFDDVMNYLFQRYAIESSSYISEDMLLKAINDVSEHNFSTFFDAYVYGNKPLPCHIEGTKLVVDFDMINSIP